MFSSSSCGCHCVLFAQLCPTFFDPWSVAHQASLVHWISQARILEWVAILFPGDLPDPEIESESPTLQADSLPSEPLGSLWLSLQLFINHHHPFQAQDRLPFLSLVFGD